MSISTPNIANPENLDLYALIKGRPISLKLTQHIDAHLSERLKTLTSNTSYTAEKLMGNDYWESMHKSDRIHCGIYISDLVERGVLPLQKVKQKHEYPVRYMLA